MITTDFFNSCKVESSQFNMEYANGSQQWNLLKNAYYKNVNTISENPIPNIFHFIWLGSDIPDMYQENISDWKNKNPEFEVMTWDDDSSDRLMQRTSKYDIFKSADNFGNKSDILRYAILYEYGGIYLDTDFLCISGNFSTLNKLSSFFGALMFDRDCTISNGIIGCCKNNEIIYRCLCSCSNESYSEISCPQTRTMFQTGPYLITQTIFNHLNSYGDDDIIIFPTSSFFPFPASHRKHATEELVYSYIRPETLACHLWHCSWQPDSKFYLGEISND